MGADLCGYIAQLASCRSWTVRDPAASWLVEVATTQWMSSWQLTSTAARSGQESR